MKTLILVITFLSIFFGCWKKSNELSNDNKKKDYLNLHFKLDNIQKIEPMILYDIQCSENVFENLSPRDNKIYITDDCKIKFKNIKINDDEFVFKENIFIALKDIISAVSLNVLKVDEKNSYDNYTVLISKNHQNVTMNLYQNIKIEKTSNFRLSVLSSPHSDVLHFLFSVSDEMLWINGLTEKINDQEYKISDSFNEKATSDNNSDFIYLLKGHLEKNVPYSELMNKLIVCSLPTDSSGKGKYVKSNGCNVFLYDNSKNIGSKERIIQINIKTDKLNPDNRYLFTIKSEKYLYSFNDSSDQIINNESCPKNSLIRIDSNLKNILCYNLQDSFQLNSSQLNLKNLNLIINKDGVLFLKYENKCLKIVKNNLFEEINCKEFKSDFILHKAKNTTSEILYPLSKSTLAKKKECSNTNRICHEIMIDNVSVEEFLENNNIKITHYFKPYQVWNEIKVNFAPLN